MQPEGISQAHGQAAADQAARNQEGLARRPAKKRLAPQDVFTPHVGPRVSGGQELLRLFPALD
eukprot:2381364-Heterocapsa_arctica.AAC.1